MTPEQFAKAMLALHREKMQGPWGKYVVGEPNFQREAALRAYKDRFASIDFEVFQAEYAKWADGDAWRPSLDTLLARCREAQAAKSGKKLERPKPQLSRDETALYAHAAKLIADALPRRLSMAQALAQVRREMERASETPEEVEAATLRAMERGRGDGTETDGEIPF